MPKIPIKFETIAASKKPLSDKFIEDAIDGVLPYGEVDVKSFLDNREADPSDLEFRESSSQAIAFRNELSDFVSDNVKLVSMQPVEERILEREGRRLERFRKKITTDKSVVGEFIQARARGEKPPFPRSAYEFDGLTISTTSGQTVDYLEGAIVDGLRSNITAQRGLVGMFVHYTSDEYLSRRAGNGETSIDKRIYLNPRSVDAVRIFQSVVQHADSAGLAFKGKILDRSYETVFLYPPVMERDAVRGDAIVLYTSDEEADKLLDIVHAVFDQNRDSFEGRLTSRIPRSIAPGVAIGEEPTDVSGESLTSHRSMVLKDVIDTVRDQERDKPSIDRRKLFRDLWERAAIAANINPDNPAFNLKK